MDFEKIKINDLLKRELQVFVSDYNNKFLSIPVLELDYSWPSLGVIDLLSFSFRHKINLDEVETRYFSSICLYLACVAAKISSSESNLSEVYRDSEGFVKLKVFFDGIAVDLPLEESLIDIFRDFRSDIPLAYEFRRPVSYDTVIVSGIMLSFLTGHSPYLKNINSKIQPSHKKVEREISIDIAKWFEKKFPQLELAHVPELYLKGAVWPFLLMEEAPPLTEAVAAIYQYFQVLKLPSKYIFSLMDAFAKCPDEHLSAISVAMAGVFRNASMMPRSLIGGSRARRYLSPLLRDALVKSRELSQSYGDWTVNGLTKEDEFFSLEKEIGSLPWVSFSEDWIRNNFDKVKNFFTAVKKYNLKESLDIVEELVMDTPYDIELRVQQIRLQFITGDYERSHEMCKLLIAEPDADRNPDFFNLWGLCLLHLQEPEIAARYFRAASHIKNIEPMLKSEILNNLGWSNLQLELNDKAKSNFLEAETLSLCPVTIWLNLAFVANLENNTEVASQYLMKAASIAPYDRRVFSNFL